jgi:hypothetical protein
MSLSRIARRAATLAVLAPLTAAGLVLAAGPAGAVPFEGDPTPTTCVRIVPLPGTGDAGSPLFGSHGYAAVLVPRIDC